MEDTYLDQFQNPESRVRALGEIPLENPNLPNILVRALADPYPGVRFRAGDRLAELDVEEKVRELFEDANGETKQAAMLAFRKEKVEEETQALVVQYAMSSSEPSIRYHALLALHHFAEIDVLKSVSKRIFELGDEDAVIVASQWSALHNWREFLPQLIQEFSSSNAKDFRFQVIIAISKLVDDHAEIPDEGIDLIISSVLDDKVSMTACQTIARLKIQRALGTLKRVPFKIFMHELLKVEAAATRTHLGDEGGRKALSKFIEDKREHVSTYACECTGRYLIDLSTSLEKAKRHNDDRRFAAELALQKLHTKK